MSLWIAVSLPDSRDFGISQDEGTAREIINRVQKLRKKAGLVPTDSIKVHLLLDAELVRVMKSFSDLIEGVLKCPVSYVETNGNLQQVECFISEDFKVTC